MRRRTQAEGRYGGYGSVNGCLGRGGKGCMVRMKGGGYGYGCVRRNGTARYTRAGRGWGQDRGSMGGGDDGGSIGGRGTNGPGGISRHVGVEGSPSEEEGGDTVELLVELTEEAYESGREEKRVLLRSQATASPALGSTPSIASCPTHHQGRSFRQRYDMNPGEQRRGGGSWCQRNLRCMRGGQGGTTRLAGKGASMCVM